MKTFLFCLCISYFRPYTTFSPLPGRSFPRAVVFFVSLLKIVERTKISRYHTNTFFCKFFVNAHRPGNAGRSGGSTPPPLSPADGATLRNKRKIKRRIRHKPVSAISFLFSLGRSSYLKLLYSSRSSCEMLGGIFLNALSNISRVSGMGVVEPLSCNFSRARRQASSIMPHRSAAE